MEKIKRPKVVKGTTTRISTPCGNLYVLITRNEGKIFEVFGWLGKSGGCARVQTEALTRAITTGLRYGVPPKAYAAQLNGIHCPAPSWHDGVLIKSCVEAIATVLQDEIDRGEPNENNIKAACEAVETKQS